MFGDLFGDMEAKQQALRERLAKINLEAESGDGAVKVTANANREIVNLSLSDDLLAAEDREQLEDLIVVAVNRALDLAAAKEAEENQELLKSMLPPGLEGLGGMFG